MQAPPLMNHHHRPASPPQPPPWRTNAPPSPSASPAAAFPAAAPAVAPGFAAAAAAEGAVPSASFPAAAWPPAGCRTCRRRAPPRTLPYSASKKEKTWNFFRLKLTGVGKLKCVRPLFIGKNRQNAHWLGRNCDWNIKEIQMGLKWDWIKVNLGIQFSFWRFLKGFVTLLCVCVCVCRGGRLWVMTYSCVSVCFSCQFWIVSPLGVYSEIHSLMLRCKTVWFLFSSDL